MKDWLIKRLRISIRNSKKIHSYWLRRNEGLVRLVIALLIYIILLPSLFGTSILLGLSFLFSGFIAIFTGVIYKGRDVMAYVLGGVLLGMTVLPTLFGAWDAVQEGDWIGAIIVFFLGVFLWLWSTRMKAGKPPS